MNKTIIIISTVFYALACLSEVQTARLGELGRNSMVVTGVIGTISADVDLSPATNYTDSTIARFASTGTVYRSLSTGGNDWLVDSTGCVWQVIARTWSFQGGLMTYSYVGNYRWNCTAGPEAYIGDIFFLRYTNGYWEAHTDLIDPSEVTTIGGVSDTLVVVEKWGTYVATELMTNYLGRIALTNDIPEIPDIDLTPATNYTDSAIVQLAQTNAVLAGGPYLPLANSDNSASVAWDVSPNGNALRATEFYSLGWVWASGSLGIITAHEDGPLARIQNYGANYMTALDEVNEIVRLATNDIPHSLEPATNYTQYALGQFASTGTVENARYANDANSAGNAGYADWTLVANTLRNTAQDATYAADTLPYTSTNAVKDIVTNVTEAGYTEWSVSTNWLAVVVSGNAWMPVSKSTGTPYGNAIGDADSTYLVWTNGVTTTVGYNFVATRIYVPAHNSLGLALLEDVPEVLYTLTEASGIVSSGVYTYEATSNSVKYVELLSGTNVLSIVVPPAIDGRVRDFGITVANTSETTIQLDPSVTWHFDADATNLTAGAWSRIYCTECPANEFSLQVWTPDSSQSANQ